MTARTLLISKRLSMQRSENSSCSLILDLENLAYISSAGLRAILLITKSVKAKGANIALCTLPNQIEEVFNISGFDKIIPIYPTRQAAADSLN